jgi:hypothetical protein
VGVELSNPNAFFNAGWITSLTTEGPTASQRVHHNPQVFFLDETAQSVDYFFSPGVTATITLLDGVP